MQTFFEPAREVSKEERLWATFCHLGALGVFIILGIGHIVVPLVIWLIKREDSPFINEHGKEALNFQISVTIYGLVCALLLFVVVGFFLLPVLAVFWFVAIIVAAIKANDGKSFRYPITIRFF
ncbi:MAG: DUF4870 domain-containing protein [Candidatus Omnitrophota bacterium]